MKLRKALIGVFVFVSALAFRVDRANAAGTTLGDRAASMQPGTWAELTTSGLSDSLMRIGAGHILQYSDSATWDPNTRQFQFIGGAHAPAPNQRFMIYSDNTNTWRENPPQSWFCQPSPAECVHHPYDHHALNPANGDMYYFDRGQRNIRRYRTSTGAWDANPITIPFNVALEIGIAYFPDRGGLVVANAWGIYFWKESTNTWSNLGTFKMGNFHNFAEYNPVHKVVIFGGGTFDAGGYSSDIYKMDAAGTITKLRNSAVPLSIPDATTTVDPVTGMYLVFVKDANDVFQFYKYDVIADVWQLQSTNNPISNNSGLNTGLMAAPVSTYGVVMFLKYNYGDPRVYLYKNAAGPLPPAPGDTQAPSIPSSVSAAATSSSQINVTWAASTDNVGVKGYRIYRCQGAGCTPTLQIGTPNSTSYADAGLAASTTYVYRVAAFDAAGNASSQSASATATTQSAGTTGGTPQAPPPPPPSPSPAPSGTIGGYPMPTLSDEKNTYLSWGWTWSPSQEPGFVKEPIAGYSVSNPDIHGDTEGDDLWSYLQMYRRTGNPVYLNRATAWANYFKNGYRNCTGSQNLSFCFDRDAFGLDHLYGWGLLTLYEYNGDAAALAEAQNIAGALEALYQPNSPYGCLPAGACTWYGLRQPGRHLIFMTRLAEITGSSRWIALRDKILDLLLNSADWDAARGMYFFGSVSTDSNLGTGAYASGARIVSPFQLAILAEGFFHAYRTTGRPELKNRLIAMARFVQQYGLDPTYQYTGSVFGVVNGNIWHNYSAKQPVTFWDTNYTISLVNLLVMGYKYTGDAALLNRAKTHFNRGTKGVTPSPTQRSSADNVVDHFVDTVFESIYLAYNKGELQYSYLIFENGGSPIVNGTPSPSPSPTDTTAPTITGVTASGITASAATVSWSTNEPSNTQVEYGLSTSYGNQTSLNSVLLTSHSQTLSGLTAATTYQYRVKSRDAAGNLATSPNFTFVTAAAPPPPPPADTTPPVISAVSASGITSSGATINWTTNESSDTQVGYGTTTSYGNQTTLNTSLVTSHSQTITGLAAGTTINYRVKSRDAAGNLATSSNFTLVTTAPPSSGGTLVGYWRFDETSGTLAADSSGSGFNGTLRNGATWAAGKTGNAVILDGIDDYVDVGNPSALQITGSMTVSAWINSNSFPSNDAAIVSKRESAVGYQLDTNSDLGSRTISFGITTPTGSRTLRYSASTVQTNTWYHVAGVYDADARTLTVYLNGLSNNGTLSGTVPSSQLNSSLNANIGKRPDSSSYMFAGAIDDVRIYNRALSQAEIQADMNRSVPDSTPPIVSVTSPGNGTTVSGAIAVSANASDNVGVVGVQFALDGANLGAEDTTAPYAITWDSASTTNGAHTLTARARDAAGNVTVSNPVLVTASNSLTNLHPLADYRFNEGAGTRASDSSGNSLNGTLMNGATWGPGRSGSGLKLDGISSFVDLGDPSVLRLTGSMTITAWINSSSFPVDDAAIVSRRDGTWGGFQLDTNSDLGRRTISLGVAASPGARVVRYGNTTLQPNTWYHVAGVYNAATRTMNVYLNGVLDNGTLDGTITNAQLNSTQPINIGRRPGRSGYLFAGVIDNVRIYDYALTQSDIRADMNGQLP
jgi:hypothetical protein